MELRHSPQVNRRNRHDIRRNGRASMGLRFLPQVNFGKHPIRGSELILASMRLRLSPQINHATGNTTCRS
jgi:hypothetical protein